MLLAAAEPTGSALASWWELTALLTVYGVAVLYLLVTGRGGLVARIPNSLQRITGLPGWAVATVSTALFGLLVAGQGFYSDVAWHVALGRDEVLFTAPHASIAIGLSFIAGSAVVAIATARATGHRLPWSALPLGALGGVAVAGFPADEGWHAAYGVDVTMWSPTHMMMIMGAVLTGVASWLVLGEAGVRPRDSRWARALHVICGWFVLLGLMAPLGEFVFGVPQFPQLYHPVLVSMATAVVLVAGRLVLGRWWTLGIVAVNAGLELLGFPNFDGPVPTRAAGLLVVSALVVELLGRRLADSLPLRFALLAGVGVGTVGLAGEWAWNAGAHQPWRGALLPEAVPLAVLAAVGAAVLATALAAAVRQDRSLLPGRPVVLGAAAAVAVALAVPAPRTTISADADVRLVDAADGMAVVEATLTPPDAADGARWFQATAWQGGTLVLADMVPTGEPGRYRSERAIPVDGRAKSLLRLHTGSAMVAVPIYLPADPAIGEAEIPAVDRVAPFERETRYLLRETKAGPPTAARIMAAGWIVIIAGWAAAFTIAVRRIVPRRASPVTAVDRTAVPV